MKTLKIFLIGVGGQGSLLASRIIGEAALRGGIPVVMSEVHGMSQRGGVVESAVILGGPRSPLIRKGSADLMVAFEPDESLRGAVYCSPDATVLINTRPLIPSSVSMGKARYVAPETVVDHLTAMFRQVRDFDATALAERAGTSKAMNIVILGALAALDILPFDRDLLRSVVPDFVPPKYLTMNLAAFDSGYEMFRS